MSRDFIKILLPVAIIVICMTLVIFSGNYLVKQIDPKNLEYDIYGPKACIPLVMHYANSHGSFKLDKDNLSEFRKGLQACGGYMVAYESKH